MHAYRGVQFGIRICHHCGHRATRREARDIDPPRVDLVRLDHFIGDASDDRRLSLSASLVARLEPVPAFRNVRTLFDRLLGGFEGRLVQGIGGGVADFIAATAAYEPTGACCAAVSTNVCTRTRHVRGPPARSAP